MARPITRFYERALYNEKTRPITMERFLWRCRNNRHLPEHLYKEKIETLLDIPRKTNNYTVDQDGRDCVTCKEYKSRDYFFRGEKSTGNVCRDCRKVYQKRRREKAKLKKDIKKVKKSLAI